MIEIINSINWAIATPWLIAIGTTSVSIWLWKQDHRAKMAAVDVERERIVAEERRDMRDRIDKAIADITDPQKLRVTSVERALAEARLALRLDEESIKYVINKASDHLRLNVFGSLQAAIIHAVEVERRLDIVKFVGEINPRGASETTFADTCRENKISPANRSENLPERFKVDDSRYML